MAATDQHYQDLWARSRLSASSKDRSTVDWSLKKIFAGYSRYANIQASTGIPWFLVAAIHGLEASFNFDTCLHNGDPLGRVTTHVPAGRGPFYTWESAAIDALKSMSMERSWNVVKCLAAAEAYNGLGYLHNHPETPSPYVWACTTIYPGHGKYTADGHFDPQAESSQCGVAAVILTILGAIR